MIYNLTLDGFKSQRKEGIYVFHSPGCFTCEHHIEIFSKHFSNFYMISTMEDPEYFESIGIKLTPETRIYKNNDLIFRKDGVMFDTQLDEMRKYLN